MFEDAVMRVAVVTVVVVVILEVLKKFRPSIEASKALSRSIAIAACGLGALVTDWLPDGQVSWEVAGATFWQSVLVAEFTYQWVIKFLKKLGGLATPVVCLALVLIVGVAGWADGVEEDNGGQFEMAVSEGLLIHGGEHIALSEQFTIQLTKDTDWPTFLCVMRANDDLALGLAIPASSVVRPITKLLNVRITEQVWAWVDLAQVGFFGLQEGDGSFNGGPFLRVSLLEATFSF